MVCESHLRARGGGALIRGRATVNKLLEEIRRPSEGGGVGKGTWRSCHTQMSHTTWIKAPAV